MTNEELENSMRFIIEHQALFAANQHQINERVVRLDTDMAEMARTQTHVNEVVAVMLNTHRQMVEKLDAFIGVLERYISEGRSGGSNGESVA